MFLKFILLFTLLPLIELALLIQLGNFLGLTPTIILVAITGIIGVSLAKSQGLIVLTNIKQLLAQGQLPTDDLIAGLLILIGGVFLLTPGLITDILGFLLIFPLTRIMLGKLFKIKFQDYINKHTVKYNFSYQQEKDEQDIIDVDYEEK